MVDATMLAGPELLRKWRERAGLGLTAAALKLGIDPNLFSKFEKGARRPGLDNAFLIQNGTDGSVPADSWLSVDDAQAAPVRGKKLRKAG